MGDRFFRKSLVIGIIILFIGVILVPNITGFQKNLFINSESDRCNEIKNKILKISTK